MFGKKTKNYVFVVIAVLVFGVLLIGFRYWRNRQNSPGTGSENANQEACQEVDKETVDTQVSSAEGSESAPEEEETVPVEYPLHKGITSTIFWVGEKASDANDNISNSPSAWDDQWKKHYGGVDSSTKRNGFLPSKFCPKENPFYVALPYNDFGDNGKHKQEIFSLVPWVKSGNIPDDYSVLKNRWIKIMHNGKTAYAQWEDVGPFGEDDQNYVFGSSSPENKENKNAGIDVSPAVRDYLGLSGIDKVDWQFVDSGNVPDGAWKKIVTTSQVYWK
jgi:hypothetical protein